MIALDELQDILAPVVAMLEEAERDGSDVAFSPEAAGEFAKILRMFDQAMEDFERYRMETQKRRAA